MRTSILSLASLLFIAHAAAAQGTGVVVTGESTLQPQLAAQLEIWLAEHGHPLVSSPLPPDAISTLIDCFVIEDETCVRGIVDRRATSDTVVFARVEASPGTNGMRDVMLVAYWLEKGRAAITDKRFCEHCTENSLRGTANDLIAALARAGSRGLGRVHITSSAANARVTLDGQPVGSTPLDRELTPGIHTVTVESDGHTRETRNVTIISDEATQVDVPLARIPQSRRVPLMPVALVAGGALALVSGGILIAVDEDPSPTGPLYITNTAPGGVALVAIGVVAAGIGGYLWFRDRTSGPTFTASRDGASLGWSGRF